jgi:hypothetical protein
MTEDELAESGPRPYWLPPEVDAILLPSELKVAIVDILQPAYQKLVLQVSDPLEKALGVSAVHLLWLVLAGQVELGKRMLGTTGTRGRTEPCWELIDRHLRVTHAQAKFTDLLHRMKTYKEKLDPLTALGRE